MYERHTLFFDAIFCRESRTSFSPAKYLIHNNEANDATLASISHCSSKVVELSSFVVLHLKWYFDFFDLFVVTNCCCLSSSTVNGEKIQIINKQVYCELCISMEIDWS